MRVVIAGGGTAGHVFPAVALAEHLRSAHGAAVAFVGSARGQEARLVPAAGFEFHAVAAEPMPRKLSAQAVRAPLTALSSVRTCRPLVADADVVVGMGGYASLSAVLAARWSRRPLVVHEQNAVPGLVNRIASRGAAAIGVGFADAIARFGSRSGRAVVTGNPVRSSILRVAEERDALEKEACAELDLDGDVPTLLVTGGSQGALALDRLLADVLAGWSGRDDVQAIVLAGPGHLGEVGSASSPRVRVVGFLERMELAYAAADVAVARAGASTTAELTVCGLPMILVPYPHATEDHQRANARELERAGAARVLEQSTLTAPALASAIDALLADRVARDRMADAALAWGRPDAAERLAALVLEAA